MSDKRYLNGLVIAAVSSAALCGQVSEAAELRVTNVAGVGDGHVRFDVTWTASWRASWTESGTRWTNWDAAWVFVKYRRKGDPGWSHASLSAKDADHSAPAGAEIDVALTGTRGMGVFLYRSAEGKGTWTNKGVKLKWLYKQDKVADPAEVELSVHAIEMVYVPKGSFYAGGGGKSYIPGRKRKQEAGSLTDGSWKTGSNSIPFKISSEAELKIASAPGCLWGTFNMGPAGKLPAAFPKGYAAFYCMKYETSQGQYAEFLSQLTEPQAASRYPRPHIPARFIRSGMHTVTKVSAGYTATKPEKACNWISWADGAAYADWAALRPMTELEYEKACRGPLEPTPYEYAWGSATLSETAATGHKDTPICPYPVGICGKAARTKAGSTYWGIATMSGHLRERTVTVGVPAGRLFTGACGDGALTADGFANVPGWPGPSTAGAGFRGGPWYEDKVRLQVSDRFLAVCLRPQRAEAYGFRGVRQAPCKARSKTGSRKDETQGRDHFNGAG